ncbi:hypothetical protein NADE_000932 [Nannochloris sp. 'desiccata']|nr:hypothetical protein KSW81_001676 [Chlorella desiccata (nom. nud.)]KAH7616098.1 hypothetical protein NADE_000932 [Chlorella desiccata (nom. nud.)]
MPRNHLLPIEVPQPASNTKRKERSPTGDQETINEAELTSRARRYLARKRAIKTELKKATDQELSGREEHASFEAEGAAAPAPELGPPLSFFGGSLGSLAHRIRRLFLKGLHTLKCPRRSAAAPAVPTPAAAPAAPQAPAPRPTAVTAPQAQPADPAHVLPANTPSFPPLLQHQQQQKSPLKMILPASPRASSPRIQAARNAPAVTRAACREAAADAPVQNKTIYATVAHPINPSGYPTLTSTMAAGVVQAQPDPGSAVPALSLLSPQETELAGLLAPGVTQEDEGIIQVVDSVLPMSPVSPGNLKPVFEYGY